jgi:ankyrin repeat protein
MMADIEDNNKLLLRLNARDFDGVLETLHDGASCEVTDDNGNGPLHVAVLNGASGEILKALLDSGADPKLRNHLGQTPLHLCKTPTSDTPTVLLRAGADIESCDGKGQTWFFNQIQTYDCVEALQKCVELGARPDTCDYRGRNALHQAISKNASPRNLHFLAGLGINPEDVDHDGNTLFHEILREGSWQILDNVLMLRPSIGLDPDRANYASGQTVLHLLCEPESRNGTLRYARRVLSLTKNANAVDDKGHTPLLLASTHSEMLVVELLRIKADPTFVGPGGLTPLHLAAKHSQSNSVGLLVETLTRLSGGDESVKAGFIDAQDDQGHTALHYACRTGRHETVAILLDAGADPSITTKGGKDILEFCAMFETENLKAKSSEIITKERQRQRSIEIARRYGPGYYSGVESKITNSVTSVRQRGCEASS